MEPVTTVTTVWSIAKIAGEASKKLYEFGKTLKDRDAKQHVDEIVENLRDLKQRAADLEDENRELREKLRFKSDEYEFKTPFWYHKTHPNQALCPKCYAANIAAPMAELAPGDDRRFCLVCTKSVVLVADSRPRRAFMSDLGGGGDFGF